MTNEEIKKEWEESEVAKRIISSEMLAINHGAPQWNKPTLVDWWLKKLADREKELVEKIQEKMQWVEDNIISERTAGYNEALEDVLDLIKEKK